MRHLLLAAGMMLTAAIGAVPASAEPPGVLLSYDVLAVVPFDSGYLVAVSCNASADPGKTEDVPLGTVVSCTLRDQRTSVSGNQGMPGREAFVVVHATFSQEVEVCLSGQAAFADVSSSNLTLVEAGPVCHEVPIS